MEILKATVLGEDCLRRALARAAVPETRDEADFPVLAAQAASTPSGTSAGGEQPKLALTLRDPTGQPREALVNLSFWWNDAPPFRGAPAYDMLPMLWAPGAQGELVSRTFALLPPVPAMREAWHEAAGWAAEFWRNLMDDGSLSAEFTAIARQAGAVVGNLSR